MLARQLRYLLVPCQRRAHVGEAVGGVRHAQTCTTSEHSALHFPAAHGLRDRLGIVRIVVRGVQLLRPHVDRLVAELLELVHEAVFFSSDYTVLPHMKPLRPCRRPTSGSPQPPTAGP